MRGRVLWYRPQEGAGVIGAEDGAELAFCVAQSELDLQGGDEVEFEPRPNGHALEAGDVRLIRRWIDRLNDEHRSLVNTFHSTVDIVH